MRMGVDKTLLDVDGEPLVSRVVDARRRRAAPTRSSSPTAPTRSPRRGFPPTCRPRRRGRLPGSARRARHRAGARRPTSGCSPSPPTCRTSSREVIRALWDRARRRRRRRARHREGPRAAARALPRRGVPAGRARGARDRSPPARRDVRAASSVVEVPVESLARGRPRPALARQRQHARRPRRRARRAESPRAALSRDPREPVRIEVVEVADPPLARHAQRERRSPSTSTTSRSRPRRPRRSDLEELAVGFLRLRGAAHRPRRARPRSTPTPSAASSGSPPPRRSPTTWSYRTRYLTSGCGQGVTFASVGHARGLAPSTGDVRVTADELYDLIGEMARRPRCTATRGGMHACGLARAGKLADRARGRRAAQRARQGARSRVARPHPHGATRSCSRPGASPTR